MVSDTTTFFLSFAAVFGALGYYLVRLERHVTQLRGRLDDLTDLDDAATSLKKTESEGGPR